LLQRVRGRYVAVINSDDAWYPGKLAEQVAYLEENPGVGATFGRVNFVDRDGGSISKDSLGFGYVFDQPNRTRGEWLNQFFWRGNCLCHPSVLIRRDLYEKVGLYDNRYRQLPDLDMWIRAVKVADIHVSESTMVRFRIMPGENTSSDTCTNRVRTLNEHFFIALGFFDGVSDELLRQGFGDHLRKPQLVSDSSLEIEKAFLFQHQVLSLDHVYRIISLMKLRDLLAEPTTRSVLAQHYDFDDKTFQRLSAETDGLQRSMLEVANQATVAAAADVQAGRNVEAVSTRELGNIIRRRLMTRANMIMKRYNLPFSHSVGGAGAGAFQAGGRPAS
jgi:hypothetical protein